MNSADILIITPKKSGVLDQEFIAVTTNDDNTKTATKVKFQSTDPELGQLGNNWRIGTIQKYDADGKAIAFTDDAEYDNVEKNMEFFLTNCDDQVEKFLRTGANGDHKEISITDGSEDFGETDEEYDRSMMDLEDQFDALNESESYNPIVVKVTFSDGNFLTTTINTTLDGAKEYYLGKPFNLGTGGDDKIVKAVKVELVEDNKPTAITEPVEQNADAHFESADIDMDKVMIFKLKENPAKAFARLILPDGRQIVGIRMEKDQSGNVKVNFPYDPSNQAAMQAIYGGVDIEKVKQALITKFNETV